MHQVVSARRNVRPNQPDETVFCLHWGEYRRGVLPAREFRRFLQIAMGSASELGYQLLLARDLQLLEPTNYERLANEVTTTKKMLATLIHKLKAESR